MNNNYGLVVSFPDQSASFVHGFEAGQIWQQMEASTPEIERTVHIQNQEVFERMAVNRGYAISWKETEVQGWVVLLAKKTNRVPGRTNPHGLRTVYGNCRLRKT